MSDADRRPDGFSCEATDPVGTRYFIQVVPTTESVGPVFLGIGCPASVRPLVRAVNRLLARAQPPVRTFEAAMVMVSRVDGAARVCDLRADDMARGRAKALAIAAEIRAGTFVPRSG